MSLFKMWPIQADDGRHNEQKEFQLSGNEWCESCKSEVSQGSTIYVQSERLWKCTKCRKDNDE